MADSNEYTRYPPLGGSGGGGVTSLNTQTGALTLLAGSGIQITSGSGTLTISNTEAGGSVTSVSVASANGFAGTVANPTTTPALTLSTTVTGILFGNGTSVAAAIASNFPTLNQNTTGTAANVTGIVAFANGGTNNSSAYTAGSVIFSNGTSLTQDNANFFWDDTNHALGIGIAPATTAVLDLVNNSGAAKAIQATGYGSNVGFRGRRADGTLSSPTASQTGDILTFFSGRGYGASQFAAASTGVINVVAGENFTNTSNATYLQFEVTPTGSVTAVESMRIAPTGNVLIGTTTDNSTQKLQVAGIIGATMFTGALAADFGSVSASNVTISSGTTTLTADGFYNNLTISGSGVLNTNGFRVFVAGTLDISTAGTGAIINNGANGGVGNSIQTGGTAGGATNSGTVGIGGAGTTGGAGGTSGATSGIEAAAPTVTAAVNGGGTQISGGGAAPSTTSGAVGRAGAVAVGATSFLRYAPDLIRGATLVQGGLGGPGGGGAGFTTTGGTNGPGGGGGASGGGVIAIYANIIARGTNSNVDIIQAEGGAGGAGGSNSNTNGGGGGGGSGGGGGWIYIGYSALTGSTITNAINCSGGAGGNGGLSTATITQMNVGGGSGNGGRVTLVNLTAVTATESLGSNGSGGATGIGVAGGIGAPKNTFQVSL